MSPILEDKLHMYQSVGFTKGVNMKKIARVEFQTNKNASYDYFFDDEIMNLGHNSEVIVIVNGKGKKRFATVAQVVDIEESNNVRLWIYSVVEDQHAILAEIEGYKNGISAYVKRLKEVGIDTKIEYSKRRVNERD